MIIGDLVRDRSALKPNSDSTSYFSINNFRNNVPRLLWKSHVLSEVEVDEFENELHGEICGKFYGSELATIVEISHCEYFSSAKIITSSGDIGWINMEYLAKVNI